MYSTMPTMRYKSLPHSANLRDETRQFQRIELVGKVIVIASCYSIGRTLRVFDDSEIDVNNIDEYSEDMLNKLTSAMTDVDRLCVFSSVKVRSQGIRPYSRKVFSGLIAGHANLRSIDSTSIESLITDSLFLTVTQLLVIVMRCVREYGKLMPSTDVKHENLKRLFWRILENLGEGLLLLYIGHGIGSTNWEALHTADGSRFPFNYSRLDRTATEFLMANNIGDSKQWRILGFELLKVIGFIELYRCINKLKSDELPRCYRIFGRGNNFKKTAEEVGCKIREVKSNDNVMDRGRAGSNGREYTRGRSSSVACRRSNSVTKESEIQGCTLFYCLNRYSYGKSNDSNLQNEWNTSVRRSMSWLHSEAPSDDRVVVISFEGPTPINLWSHDRLAVVFYTAPPGTVNYQVLTSELRAAAMQDELMDGVKKWSQRRSSSQTLRKALEQSHGSSKRSVSNSRDNVPEWAKAIQDRRGHDLGFSPNNRPITSPKLHTPIVPPEESTDDRTATSQVSIPKLPRRPNHMLHSPPEMKSAPSQITAQNIDASMFHKMSPILSPMMNDDSRRPTQRNIGHNFSPMEVARGSSCVKDLRKFNHQTEEVSKRSAHPAVADNNTRRPPPPPAPSHHHSPLRDFKPSIRSSRVVHTSNKSRSQYNNTNNNSHGASGDENNRPYQKEYTNRFDIAEGEEYQRQYQQTSEANNRRGQAATTEVAKMFTPKRNGVNYNSNRKHHQQQYHQKNNRPIDEGDHIPLSRKNISSNPMEQFANCIHPMSKIGSIALNDRGLSAVKRNDHQQQELRSNYRMEDGGSPRVSRHRREGR